MYPTPTVPPVMKIELLSHGFVVSDFDARAKVAVVDFARSMAEYHFVKVSRDQFERKVLRVFASYTSDRLIWRFHANQFNDFMRHLAGYGWSSDQIQITRRAPYVAQDCTHPLKDGMVPFDYQEPLIDYVLGPCPEHFAPSKILTLQTGKGKSLTTLFAISRAGKRVMLVVRGKYVDKWVMDINEAFDYNPGDLIVVRGTKDLTRLMNAALDDTLTAKFIITTTTTWYKYMHVHELANGNSELVYAVPPDRFYETLKIGIRNTDEVHEDFHCNFRHDLYTHTLLTNSMSATMEPESPFLAKMYDLMFPAETRGPEVEYDKYISLAVLWYSINEPSRIRCMGPRGYNHIQFEESMIRNRTMLKNYFDMHVAIIHREFASVFEPGQSALVLFSTIEMARLFQPYLKEKLPQLEVQRYVRGLDDGYEENFQKGDVVVSTYKSAGTAVDRRNLRVTFRSMWLSSKQGNIQALGRTRRLKDWPDVTPRFICISAREIPKHRDYTRALFSKLDGKVLASHEMQTSYRV